jgi:hypothetical protein
VEQLREGGVYALPDESEVIVVAQLRGAYLLYAPQDWTLYPYVPAIYELHASGQIHYRGEPTYWRIGDLSDTGRTGTSLASRGKSS